MVSQSHTWNADAVIEREKAHIAREREDESQPLSGLAFSGGGIRSAMFCLGVMQALARAGVLKKMDYLSTSSGGGYIGSSLTWFLHRGLPDGSEAGTDPERFPFGSPHQGARNQSDNPNGVLDFIRQHGYYLTPGRGLDIISFIGYVVRTVLVSFTFYAALLTVVMIGLYHFGIFSSYQIEVPLAGVGHVLSFGNPLLLLSVVFVALFVLLSLSYSVITRVPIGTSSWRYQFRVYNQIILGALLKLFLAALVVGSLPLVQDWLERMQSHIHTAGASTLMGTLIGWVQYYRGLKSDKQMGLGSSITSIVAALLIMYGLLLGTFILAENVIAAPDLPTLEVALVLSGFFLLVGWCANVNYSTAHRMYRDRLMETFMPDTRSLRANRWGFSEAADSALIETFCQSPNRRPYHLINSNLVLADSPRVKFRGRGGDNFILSPLYCGSDATGWRQSADYMKRAGRGMTLSSAMAISGAAVNPNAGNSGRGVTRNRWVSILYSLLNLRFGYWGLNPRYRDYRFFVPNYFNPVLWRSILTRGLREDRRFVELSDGGHFDNTAVYELIRRKLSVIVICDGGADPDYRFSDMGNLIERVRVDFGAQIEFDEPGLDLDGVRPRVPEQESDTAVPPLARRGFAVARIRYADGGEGRLLYVKSTLTAGMPEDVYSYKSRYPSFPHQSTTDQFFDEVQVEAYREVGYYVGWQLLEANAGVAPGQSPEAGRAGRWL